MNPADKARVAVINAAAFCAHIWTSTLTMTMLRFSLRNFCAIYRPSGENRLIRRGRSNEINEWASRETHLQFNPSYIHYLLPLTIVIFLLRFSGIISGFSWFNSGNGSITIYIDKYIGIRINLFSICIFLSQDYKRIFIFFQIYFITCKRGSIVISLTRNTVTGSKNRFFFCIFVMLAVLKICP